MIKEKRRVDTLDKIIAQKIKIRRIELGLSQRQIAQALNISIQQVQKYENGTNRISASKIPLLTKVLKVPIKYFFTKDELTDLIFNENEKENEKETLKLIWNFKKIKSSKLRNQMINICNSMASIQI